VPTLAEEFFTTERFGDPSHQPSNPMRLAERLRSQSTMVASWPTVPRTHPDRAPLTVLAEITGGLGGTFFEEIRTRRGLAYQVSTFNQNRMLATDPPTQEQLDRAKAGLIGAWKTGGQTNGARVGRLATYELAGQSPEQLRAWPEQIEAVTVEDLRRVAQTWLDRPPLATGVLAGTSGSDANPGR
jgi:zinc protease